MNKILLASLLFCPAYCLSFVDVSILKPGNYWKYEHLSWERHLLTPVDFDSVFATTTIRIDSVVREGEMIRFQTTQIDSGDEISFWTGQTHFEDTVRSQYRIENGNLVELRNASDSGAAATPFFMRGITYKDSSTFAAYHGDTLNADSTTYREGILGRDHYYVESIGQIWDCKYISFSSNTHGRNCYSLLEFNGNEFRKDSLTFPRSGKSASIFTRPYERTGGKTGRFSHRNKTFFLNGRLKPSP